MRGHRGSATSRGTSHRILEPPKGERWVRQPARAAELFFGGPSRAAVLIFRRRARRRPAAASCSPCGTKRPRRATRSWWPAAPRRRWLRPCCAPS